MIEVPANRELATAYNDALAELLLKIANAEDKITAAAFSGQLFNWPGTNARILRNELNFNIKPTTPSIRKELKSISSAADKLNAKYVFNK